MRNFYFLFLLISFQSYCQNDQNSNKNSNFNDLVWSDEFDTNGAIDATKWHHQTIMPNGFSWYNGEVQHYTNRTDNSYVENGKLIITAKKESYTYQGHTKEYTSARLNSKFAFTYGRIEIRAKLPEGVGTWPAIWMLGQNINEVGAYWQPTHGSVSWPACGEIDIMEHWGTNQNYIQSAMHTPSSHGGTVNKGGRYVTNVSSDFHVYEMEWTENEITFKVDGITHYTYNPGSKNSDTWPFDAPQYLLLNIAILPSIDSNFTQSSMEVDYVRIYQNSTLGNDEIIKEEKFKLYPIPVKDQLNVELPKNILKADLEIYNSNGKRVLTKLYSNIENQIDLSNLSSGIYYIRFVSDGESFSSKFIKSN